MISRESKEARSKEARMGISHKVEFSDAPMVCLTQLPVQPVGI